MWRGLHAAEDCHYVADSWLLRLLGRLTAPPAPLVAIDGDETALLTTGSNTLSLTSLGEEVLRGRIDWLGCAAGTDRWLGGVHLTDPDTAWRWDAADRKLRRRG